MLYARKLGFTTAKLKVTLSGPDNHAGMNEPEERATEVAAACREAVGGLTEALRVCDLAAKRGRRIIPHCWKTGVSIAASAHLAAVTPHCPYFEFLPAELTDSLLRKQLVKDEIRLVDKKLSVPRKPGLGIEVDMDALRSFEQN